MSCEYKRYSASVLEYLLNRPRHFVKHCLKKKDLANSVDINGVKIKDHGIFLINSFSDKHKSYAVSFGDKSNMPKCTCNDWLRSGYLCKHFFLVFRKFPQTWSWDSLSLLYRQSPFLNLDINKKDITMNDSDKFQHYKKSIPEYINNIADCTYNVSTELYHLKGSKKTDLLSSASNIKIGCIASEVPIQECIITDDPITGGATFTTNSTTFENESSLNNTKCALPSFPLLSTEDVEDILNNRMLSDSVIHRFQNLIKKRHLSSNGFQDHPILGQKLFFKTLGSQPFVQIIYNGHNHWLALSTYGCKYGEIYVLDSNFQGNLSIDTQNQICSLLKYDEAMIKVNVLPVQQQEGYVDCGLFSLAFVEFILSNNKNPVENIWFDQKLMFFMCLTKSSCSWFDKKLCSLVLEGKCNEIFSTFKFCKSLMPFKRVYIENLLFLQDGFDTTISSY
ncbi:uncharacterized protein LOC136085454 [Hydra vulgaris]|uniref:Uncharacterized protein LOC136085454 n=1 Tax=Hydra vulgaris TaxID=6087 RepID=A0ABM4CLZ6_HYDVU